MRKHSIKLVSVILSICLLAGCLSVISFAGETQPLKLVVIGDSIAAGTKLFNANVQCYGAILAKTNGWDYVNYAVPGHTTQAFNEEIHEPEVEAAIKEADIITVSIGGNNFLMDGLVGMIADGVLKGDYSKMDEIMVTFNESFDSCIKDIKAMNPDAQLFVQTLYNPMPGIIGESYAEGQHRLNAAYKAYLEKNPGAYTLIDIEPDFEGHMDYIATDFIHPNKDGHAVIAKNYQEKFYEMGLADTTEIVEPTTEDIIDIDILVYLADMWFQITNAVKLMFAGISL